VKELIDLALSEARKSGASYADARIVNLKNENITVRRGTVGSVSFSESRGIGVRAIVDGAWGFASTPELDEEAVRRTAIVASSIAKASARCKGNGVVLSEERPVRDSYKTPVKVDPFTVKLEDKIELLLSADRLLGTNPKVRIPTSFLAFKKEEKVFGSTEGAFIEQQLVESGGGISALAVGPGEVQSRSYPNGRSGGHRTAGYEYIESLDLLDHAERISNEAVELLEAPQCPSGTTDLLLHGSCLALQIHESVGHPVELDRVLGSEVSMAGGSFATTDMLGALKYGSDMVNLTADATLPQGLGTFGYDDEGVPGKRTPVVRDGLFVGYLSSRETAPAIGQTSSGAARATSWNKIPLVRMTNVNLEPGDVTKDEIIRSTKDGILMEGMGSGSIDDMRTNFQFGPECAWEVKDGSIGRMLKNPTYTAKTLDFWRCCDAIAGDDWQIWGIPSCGKGQPGQLAHVGHGASTARFSGVKVGVGKW
jgi:TldD protein